MSPERFDHLLSIIGPLLTKRPCRCRKPIPPEIKLMLTLRFLATGDGQQTESFSYLVGKTTISNAVRDTCKEIWTALNKEYLKIPTTTQELINIALEFEDKWNFPHCLGAIDGKHIMIECPRNAGSAYFNYKNFHSIVLLAICDRKYCFTFVEIGSYGSKNMLVF